MSTDRAGATGRETEATDRLEIRIVEYPDAPDRVTIYPPGLAEFERMTHWLSADRSAFVSLELWR